MWNMNDVIKIEYRGGFVYHVAFDDGKSGDIDFSEYLGRVLFLNLCEIQHFSRKQPWRVELSLGQTALT